MFNYLKKLGRGLSESSTKAEMPQPLSKVIGKNIYAMKHFFCEDNDFVVREFEIPVSSGIRAAIFYIDGLAGADIINDSILQPLMVESRKAENRETLRFKSISSVTDWLVLSGEIEIGTTYGGACDACLVGDCALMIDGFSEFVHINAKGYEKRSITEPQTETVVRGPREGFTEVLRTNTALIRRKLKTTHLRMDMINTGEKSNTALCLTYIDDVANPELVREVKRRLASIDTDAILSSGYIEEFIEDTPLSIFQTINYTEKPDIVAAKLLEGRCALIIDGSPFVLTMPMLFIECFQSPEDYAIRSYFATFLRIIRVIGFFFAIISPGVYVALTAFHQELIPTTLLFTIVAASEDIPFNSMFETAIMLLTFEIIREAGVRLPRPVGQAISIVGALVMGQAAIQAGIVGAPVVIVIAFSAVSTFLVPNLSDIVTLLRWFLLILGSILGGYGIALGLMLILIRLASLESFGSVYLYPFAPFNIRDMKDSIIRMPLWRMHTRPDILKPQDSVRQNMDRPDFGQEGDEL